MMRTLIWMMIGVGLLFYSDFVVAAPDCQISKASLSREWNEDQSARTILHLGVDTDWDWLELLLSGKFFLTPVEDLYSSCDLKLNSPEFCKGLVFKSGYDWNDKYKIYNEKLNYSFSPWKVIRLEIDYQNEERTPELATGCPYRFNNESIVVTWQQKPWKNSFNLARNDKDYYEDDQFTSLKYQLGDTLTWHPQTNMQLRVGYEEDTGDCRTSSYKDYWKQQWVFNGQYQTKWRYEFEYRELFWERGYEPYRSSYKTQLKMGRKVTSNAKLTFSASFQDLNYYSSTPDYTEPGEYYKAESDVKSRKESKAGVELQLDYSEVTFKMSSFWGHTDYKSASVKDPDKLGIYATMIWGYHNFELSLKMAPWGDLSTQDAYYSMEIDYKPREKVAVSY